MGNVNMVNCVNVPSTRVPNLLHLPIPRRVTNAIEPCHTYTAMQNGVIDLSGIPIPKKVIGSTKPMLFQDREQFKSHSSNPVMRRMLPQCLESYSILNSINNAP